MNCCVFISANISLYFNIIPSNTSVIKKNLALALLLCGDVVRVAAGERERRPKCGSLPRDAGDLAGLN